MIHLSRRKLLAPESTKAIFSSMMIILLVLFKDKEKNAKTFHSTSSDFLPDDYVDMIQCVSEKRQLNLSSKKKFSQFTLRPVSTYQITRKLAGSQISGDRAMSSYVLKYHYFLWFDCFFLLFPLKICN